MSRRVTLIVLGLLLLAGVLIRVREIEQPIVRFHPTRHYRSAVLARACYYDLASIVPAWARSVADANRQMQPAGELPVMEWLACGAYLATGRENVAIPRVLAVIIWVSGAVPLWLLARRLASPNPALVAVSLYLFLPYGIVASRNFQPDQLMTVSSLWAILALVRHHDRPTRGRRAAAAALIGAAGVIKPMSVFLTVPVALVLAGGVPIVLAGMVAPGMYYGYSAIAGSLVQDQMRMRFEPHLLTSAFFWQGMGQMVASVHTVPLFVTAVAATSVAPDRLARRVLAALFGGYLAFAVAFTYHMPTHDYYHLPYLAAVALGVAVALSRFTLPPAATCAACAVVALIGGITAWPRLPVANAERFARIYEEVGELVEHDTRALFLDTEYGFAMMYHGQVSGDSWPNRDDLAAEAIDGRTPVDAEARFVRDYEAWRPTYFIVTDMTSLAASPDLGALLDRRATPVRFTDLYRIYRFAPRPARDHAQDLDRQ